MSNLKDLFEKIKQISSLPKEVIPEYEEADPKDKEDEPSIYIDGFIINSDGKDLFNVMDETNAIEDFTGKGDQIVEFFKGVYDAYVEDYDEKKSNDFYNKGFELTEVNATDDDDDEEEAN